MPKRTWNTDFRRPAIEASIDQLSDEQRQDPLSAPTSYCLPATDELNSGITPGKVFLVAIVAALTLMSIGPLLLALHERQLLGDVNSVLVTMVAGTSSLTGFVMLIAPLKYDSLILRPIIGARFDETRARLPDATTLSAEVSNSDPNQLNVRIDGDDYGILFLDTRNRRIVIEGINARYQIHSNDVIELVDFEFLNYLGATVCFRISDEVQLSLAIAKVSQVLELRRQLPFQRLLSRFQRNRVLEEIVACLS